MLKHTLTAVARTKMLVFIPLLMVCILCFSKNIFSQNKTASTTPVAKMAKMDASGGKITSWDVILADPTLVCPDGGQVLSFSLSFQPKGLDYAGPFATQGNRLPAKGIEWINKFKEQGVEKVQMFIEDIRVKYKGEDKMLSPVIITVLLPKK